MSKLEEGTSLYSRSKFEIFIGSFLVFVFSIHPPWQEMSKDGVRRSEGHHFLFDVPFRESGFTGDNYSIDISRYVLYLMAVMTLCIIIGIIKRYMFEHSKSV